MRRLSTDACLILLGMALYCLAVELWNVAPAVRLACVLMADVRAELRHERDERRRSALQSRFAWQDETHGSETRRGGSETHEKGDRA